MPEIDDSVPRGPKGEEYYKSGGKGNKIKGFEVELAGEVMLTGTCSRVTPTPIHAMLQASA